MKMSRLLAVPNEEVGIEKVNQSDRDLTHLGDATMQPFETSYEKAGDALTDTGQTMKMFYQQ